MKNCKKEEIPEEWADMVGVDSVYPRSILRGYQSGRIFLEEKECPKACLFWHQCGFGYYGGEDHEEFLSEIAQKIERHDGVNAPRLVLQIGEKDWQKQRFFEGWPQFKRVERYAFRYRGGAKRPARPLAPGEEAATINGENYDRLSGKVIPAFSWASKEEFLKNGFGYAIFSDGRFAAAAFSAAVSDDAVDIGLETAEEFRGRGYASYLASKMVEKIVAAGKTPLWGCVAGNIGSRKTAEAVGFEIQRTDLMYRKKHKGE